MRESNKKCEFGAARIPRVNSAPRLRVWEIGRPGRPTALLTIDFRGGRSRYAHSHSARYRPAREKKGRRNIFAIGDVWGRPDAGPAP